MLEFSTGEYYRQHGMIGATIWILRIGLVLQSGGSMKDLDVDKVMLAGLSHCSVICHGL